MRFAQCNIERLLILSVIYYRHVCLCHAKRFAVYQLQPLLELIKPTANNTLFSFAFSLEKTRLCNDHIVRYNGQNFQCSKVNYLDKEIQCK